LYDLSTGSQSLLREERRGDIKVESDQVLLSRMGQDKSSSSYFKT
jgi:hypothetical protein